MNMLKPLLLAVMTLTALSVHAKYNGEDRGKPLAPTQLNAKWQAEMSRLFASEGAPDEAWERLEEVFNLEDQLAASGH